MNGRTLLRDEQGAALLMVLVFGVLAAVVAFVYQLGQMQLTRQNLARPVALQARLNARSGVYWALERLGLDSAGVDTLPTMDARRTDLFNSFLFAGARSDSSDSVDTFLPLGGEPEEAVLFDDSSYGDATLRRELSGTTVMLRSVGRYRARRSGLTALLASRVPWSPETLLYVPTGYPRDPFYRWEPGVFGESDVREEQLQEILSAFRKEFEDTTGFELGDMPVTVTASDELGLVEERMENSLFLTGEFGAIAWREDRCVVIDGDLQVTGSAEVRDVRFLVSGEVRVYDDVVMRNVSIVCGGRVLMHGKASFSGDILALGTIAVGGEAEVVDRSTLVAVARRKPRAPADSSDAVADTVRRFTVTLEEWARVDAAVAAIGGNASMHVSSGVTMRGVVYVEGELCFEGSLSGVIRARSLVNCGEPKDQRRITGRQEPIDDLYRYHLPVFMGRPVAVSWTEEVHTDE